MQETYDQFYQDMVAIATKYSMDRLRVTTLNFDREFKRGQDGSFNLVGTKAVIRVLGKTSKVPIGEGTPYATYEEAWEATKKYWSEYYREIRARRTPAKGETAPRIAIPYKLATITSATVYLSFSSSTFQT